MDDSGLSPTGHGALDLIDAGMAVFPLFPRSKVPWTQRGLNDWDTDKDNIRDFWRDHPTANVGVACGAPSHGLVAIDLDTHGDSNGMETLRSWEVEHGELPETVTVITGSGGRHLLYRCGREVRNSANEAVGVDVRGDGGFIVAPPSIHPNGEAYEWSISPEDMEVATANWQVYEFIDFVRPAQASREGERFELPESIDGNRNDTLFRYAASLRSRGLSKPEIMQLVTLANQTRCKPPLGDAEVRKLVGSSTRYEQGDGFKGKDSGGVDPSAINFRSKRGGLRTNLLAQEIIRRNSARLIDGAPAVWTGQRWEFGKRAVNRCVLDLADDAKNQDKNEVYSYVMDKAPSISSDVGFDGRYYVQFSNCTFDVMAEQVVEPSPKMCIMATLPVPLDMDVEANEADDFLDSISDGDEAVKLVLEEIIAACMCSRRVISQSPMCIGRAGNGTGKASNGKSTFLNWIRAICGTCNISSLDIATLGQRFQAGRLAGKLANIGDDIPDGFLRGEELSVFKKAVTGDSIYTDVKNGEGFEFRPTATLVFSMNSIPRLSDTTEGVFRRLAFVPFKRRFSPDEPGFDPNMAAKLAKPEVLARGALLALIALKPLIQRGHLTPLPDTAEEVEQVKQDNDSVERWLYEEDIQASDINGRRTAEVYRQYMDWCREAGERNPYKQRTFSSKIIESKHFERVTFVTQSARFGPKTGRAFVASVTN